MRVGFFLLRVLVVGLLVVGGVLAAVSVPRGLLYATPANSFDAVFDRIGNAAILGAVLGMAAGVAAAAMLGRGRATAGVRWGEAAAAGGVFLVLLAVVLDLS